MRRSGSIRILGILGWVAKVISLADLADCAERVFFILPEAVTDLAHITLTWLNAQILQIAHPGFSKMGGIPS